MLRVSRVLIATPKTPEGIYLNVPYKDKEEAKAKGAKWDEIAKKWWAINPQALTALSKWALPEDKAQAQGAPPKAPYPEPTDHLVTSLGTCRECHGKLYNKITGRRCSLCEGSGLSENTFAFLRPVTDPGDLRGFYFIHKTPNGQFYIYANQYDEYLSRYVDKYLDPKVISELHKLLEDKKAAQQQAAEILKENARRYSEARELQDRQMRERQAEEKATLDATIKACLAMTVEEAKAQGLSIGTGMSASNAGGSVQAYHPGDGKIPPHKHLFKQVREGRNLTSSTCVICGAHTFYDSSD